MVRFKVTESSYKIIIIIIKNWTNKDTNTKIPNVETLSDSKCVKTFMVQLVHSQPHFVKLIFKVSFSFEGL